MSTTQELLTNIVDSRDNIRSKLVDLGMADGSEKLNELETIITNIPNQGAVSAQIKNGETYVVPQGYHNGEGTVVSVGGGAPVSSGQPIPVYSEEEMNEIVQNATEDDEGKIYAFLGEDTDTYEQGAYYLLEGEEKYGKNFPTTFDFGIVVNGRDGDNVPNDITFYGEVAPILQFYKDTRIKKITFANCTNVQNSVCEGAVVTDIVLPEGVTRIGQGAFYNCTSLVNINMPSTVTEIGPHAFNNCSKMTMPLIMPENVTSIGNSAFKGCTGLTSVYWNAISIDGIGTASAPPFYGCKNISSVVFADNVKRLPHYLFREAGGTMGGAVILPEGLEYIGADVFNQCKLTSINIPSTVTFVGTYAFYKCPSLTTVYWNAPIIESVGSTTYPVFDSCSALTNFVIGENVLRLPTYMLRECTGITDIVIPSNIETIGDQVFYSCTKLANVTFKGTPVSIGANTFGGCSALATINVPWAEGAVAGAPWGAPSSTINYNYTEE